ncbi:MAG: aminoacetone oxidase family FAD-binding enzyme [Phycisphaerales bacterium]|nr:aminoacetone oxidase family FAD-binding enzyme [Phycisphaerales bacterium]
MSASGSEPAFDIAVVGAGAAGLFAAIHAARSRPGLRVVALDRARTLGAKILVAGGGRCNVTHYAVTERDFCGGSPSVVRRVLHRFPVSDTVEFFQREGVELKREETGKLFPVSDKARSILDALLGAASALGVEVRHPWIVDSIARGSEPGSAFVIQSAAASVRAGRVILATGGKSLPKSGSDGSGYALAQGFGHSLTQLIEPALVPLTLPAGHWITTLSGVAIPARLRIVGAGSARSPDIEGAVLCTHFGLSGPAILDMSRHWIHAHAGTSSARLRINWIPSQTPDSLHGLLTAAKGQSILSVLRGLLPERFLRAACAHAGVEPTSGVQQVSRSQRAMLVSVLSACEIEPTGTRGFVAAETTAGGVPLAEIDPETMESTRCHGLFFCGEILDVDGRIGGFSFQWAWSSAFVAGCAAARLTQSPTKA